MPLVVLGLLAHVSWAQEPAGPPPPRGRGVNDGSREIELLPDLGRIGAEVAVLGGVSWNPYEVGRGVELAGYVNLPLRRVPGGKLFYELFLGVGFATSAPAPGGAGGGVFLPPQAPPTPSSVRTRLRVLDASPFGLKYVFLRGERARLRPYLAAGVDALVAVADEEFAGIPVVAEGPLSPPGFDRGVPEGATSIAIGGHGAAGFEIRAAPGLSVNVEYRFTATEGKNGRLQLVSGALGFHW